MKQMTTQALLDALTEGNAAKILQAAKDVGEAIKAGLIVDLSALEKEEAGK